MIDYRDIIDNLQTDRIIALMQSLGADNYVDKPDYCIFPTICHHSDPAAASMKLYYYKNSHNFYCYTECGSLSIFNFLKNYYEARNIDYDWFNDVVAVAENCSSLGDTNTLFNAQIYKSERTKYEAQKVRKDLPTFNSGILSVFSKIYPVEWLNDGINRATMDKYNILYSHSQNKIIIPHFNANGALVGIRGRALDDWEVQNVGKYMPVQIEQQWYAHPLSLNLYGLNYNKSNIKDFGICFVFESEKSVMQVEGFNMPNCAVAACGSNLNKYQVDLLMKYCRPREIVICFDQEEERGGDKYFKKLWDIGKRYTNYANISFIYDRQGLLKLKDSPSDNGEATFRKLLERRVKIN